MIDIIKNHLGVKDVYVGSSIKVTSQEGQTVTKGDIWEDDFVLYYAPERGTLFTPSFGYRFMLTGVSQTVKTMRDPRDLGDIVRLNWAYQDNILDVDAAYLLDQVIT